jgi:hypothetical protein
MIFIIATGGFADYIFPARQGSAVGVASSFGVAGTVVLIRRLGRRYEELSAVGGFRKLFFITRETEGVIGRDGIV